MEFIKCTGEHLDEMELFFKAVLKNLEENINYPKWTKDYPNRQTVGECIKNGEQYACVDNGKILGAVALNENPAGNYEAGNWSKSLERGEYLVVHTLAVLPDCLKRGIGDFIIKECIAYAQKSGYKAIRLDMVTENTPAARLYEKNGFSYAGTVDLKRFAHIPLFDLYELNF